MNTDQMLTIFLFDISIFLLGIVLGTVIGDRFK